MGYKGMCRQCSLSSKNADTRLLYCSRYNSTCQQVARNCHGPSYKCSPAKNSKEGVFTSYNKSTTPVAKPTSVD